MQILGLQFEFCKIEELFYSVEPQIKQIHGSVAIEDAEFDENGGPVNERNSIDSAISSSKTLSVISPTHALLGAYSSDRGSSLAGDGIDASSIRSIPSQNGDTVATAEREFSGFDISAGVPIMNTVSAKVTATSPRTVTHSSEGNSLLSQKATEDLKDTDKEAALSAENSSSQIGRQNDEESSLENLPEVPQSSEAGSLVAEVSVHLTDTKPRTQQDEELVKSPAQFEPLAETQVPTESSLKLDKPGDSIPDEGSQGTAQASHSATDSNSGEADLEEKKSPNNVTGSSNSENDNNHVSAPASVDDAARARLEELKSQWKVSFQSCLDSQMNLQDCESHFGC